MYKKNLSVLLQSLRDPYPNRRLHMAGFFFQRNELIVEIIFLNTFMNIVIILLKMFNKLNNSFTEKNLLRATRLNR